MKSKFFSLLIVFALIVSFTTEGSFNILSPNVVKAETEPPLYQLILSNEEANELKFRKEFGLDTSLATIQSTMKNYEIGQYGVHLSKEEEEKLSKRITFQEQLNPVLTKLLNDKFPGEFSLYIDQSNNGTYHIGIKKAIYNQQTIDALVGALFTDEYKYELEFIAYSEEDLDGLVNRILENRNYLEKQNIIFNEVYPDIIKQKVNIGVVDVSDEKIKLLQHLFGDVVYAYEANETVNNNRSVTSSVMKGGLEIVYKNSNNDIVGCSIGFMVKPPNGVNFIVTAAHCGNGSSYKQGTTSFGNMIYKKESGSTDAGMLAGPSSVTYTGGKIYKTATTTDSYNSTQNASEDVIGEAVCMSGASSSTNPVSCGTLTNKNFATVAGGISFTKLRKASYTSTVGDSGGTVYSTSNTLTKLKGVHKGSNGGEGVYSHLEYVMDGLNAAYGSAVNITF